MKKGRVSEITYKRSILKNLMGRNEGLRPGVEAADMQLEGVTVVMSSNCILEWFCGCEEYCLQQSMNGVYEKGGVPSNIQIEMNIPTDFEEKILGKIIKRFYEAARKRKLEISQCRVYAGNISVPIAHVTVVGTTRYMLNRTNIRPGMGVVMTGSIAIGGTAVLAEKYKEKLSAKFSGTFVSDCLRLKEYISIEKEAMIASSNGAIALHSLSGSGTFGGIWELVSPTDMGITVNIRDIPVWQETVEVSEVFDINPYVIDATGALLVVAEDCDKIVRSMQEQGVYASVIGKITDSRDRIAINGDEIRYLEPPRGDELYKLI